MLRASRSKSLLLFRTNHKVPVLRVIGGPQTDPPREVRPPCALFNPRQIPLAFKFSLWPEADPLFAARLGPSPKSGNIPDSLSSAKVRRLWEEPAEETGLTSGSVGILAIYGGEDVKNLFNHPNFLPSPTNVTSSSFGIVQIESAENSGNRTGQVSLRLNF